jgi:hypothetical protein
MSDFMEGLIGRWNGTVRTWLDPAAAPVENEIGGTFRRVFDSGALLHEYRSHVGEHRSDGVALIGIDIATNRHCVSWVDTFHTGSNVMLFAADDRAVEDGVSLHGSYAAGDQTWGWRVSIRVAGADELRIDHFNIEPGAEEVRAIEIVYRREAAQT